MSLGKMLVALYRFLNKRRWLLFSALALVTIVMAMAATKIRFTEDPLQLFPESGEGSGSARAFVKLKAKDKIIVQIVNSEEDECDPDLLADAAQRFRENINDLYTDGLVEASEAEEGLGQNQVIDFIYSRLPIYLESDDYKRIEECIASNEIKSKLESSVAILLSPAGAVANEMISRDPLAIGTPLLARLDSLRMGVKMNIYRDNIYSEDSNSLFFILSPKFSTSESLINEKLTKALESAERVVEDEFKSVDVMISGAPLAAAYNARAIKRDTVATSSIALLLIVALFWLSFRNYRTLFILILPALFGAMFAIAFMAMRGNPVSAIAVGAGATVMGIALSYSIHVISHLKHVDSIEQLIEELAYPLTVGGFTTIGAFIGLLFTNSLLLQDFGLFSALTLTGTTLFSLLFLPHFVNTGESKETKVYSFILKIASFEYEKVKWLKWFIVLLFFAGVILAPGVKFDSDFSNLGFEPEGLSKAQLHFENEFGGGESRVFLLNSSEDFNEAADRYYRDNILLDSLVISGSVLKSASVSWIIPPVDVQQQRIDMWEEFWSAERRRGVIKDINNYGESLGFNKGAFVYFTNLISKKYDITDFSEEREEMPSLIKEWIEERDGVYTFITQLHTDDTQKEELYNTLSSRTGFGILDRAHFSSEWAVSIKEDFNFILLVSSLLVFITLLISYGRVELAAMAFLPMAVSWVIILGLMHILSIEFNIFNILLATFIFGIGDDFSIFVLDGLSAEYQGRESALASHKSAIFFSTFTVLAGVGSMAFASHPALRSIALVSIVGISAVWIVAYTIQPIVYRFFISRPAAAGVHPYTLFGVIQMIITFSAFLLGCLFAAFIIPVLIILPVKHSKRVLIFRRIIRAIVFLPVKLSPTVRIFAENRYAEEFSRPAVIVANHQSFIDILMLLSLHPKIIMMTNRWVWNSPVFGHIVRFAGFVYHKDGLDNHLETLRPKVKEGYSVLIFPEGTRSADMEIHRFHKGAFKIAQELSLDIVPVVIYGNGNLVSKRQPFYVKRGVIGYRILNRIKYDDMSFGSDYRERARKIATLFRREYASLRSQYDNPTNLFFFQKIMSGYIYKGPVTEWYIRIKMKIEQYYELYNRIIPHNARITDIGCGYGTLCFMLGVLSEKRVVTGIDYDKEKIDVAKSSWLSGGNINFIHADAMSFEFPDSDVFVMNDVLHYLMAGEQELLLNRILPRVKSGGFLILRDGDSEKVKDHKVTKITEWFSIKALGFNKALHPPCFTSGSKIKEIAERMDCIVEEMRNDKLTSNTIYIIKPKQE